MVIIQTEDFDIKTEYDALRAQTDEGAIVTFTGLVREHYDLANDNAGKVQSLYLEHYPGMTEKCLQDIAEQAAGRWQIVASRIIHRVGELKAKDQIVFVGTVSAHRADAFAACRYVIERVKQIVPIWKREYFEGGDMWIEGATADPTDGDARQNAYRVAGIG